MSASCGLTVVVGVAQRPGFIRVEVCVPPDAGAGEVGVGEETPFPVKRRAVAVETGGEEDHDVRLLPVVLDLRVRHLLKQEEEVRNAGAPAGMSPLCSVCLSDSLCCYSYIGSSVLFRLELSGLNLE